MHLRFRSYSLRFKHPFGVSSNTRSETPVIFVRLSENETHGYGEACLPAYLGEKEEDSIRFLEAASALLSTLPGHSEIKTILKQLDVLQPGCNAAKASLDIALHDLYAKREGKSFAEWKGIPKAKPTLTSFTIGIDHEEKVKQKISDAADFSILKIKAGTADDLKLLQSIRSVTSKPLYVDVNQGWKNKEEALELCNIMASQDVLLLEQPMPVSHKKDMTWLTAHSPIPTIADESVKRLKDLESMDAAFHGINIKLMKSTGLEEAYQMIQYCKQHRIKIMLGCMAESSCATTAMAQFMGFADFVDLDAPELYTNDPFLGVTYKNGRIYLPDGPGLGCVPKPGFHFD